MNLCNGLDEELKYYQEGRQGDLVSLWTVTLAVNDAVQPLHDDYEHVIEYKTYFALLFTQSLFTTSTGK